MKKPVLRLPERLTPYAGVIYFIVILTVSHFFWKFTMLGDESDSMVSFFGLDLSFPFQWMAKHLTLFVVSVMQYLGSDIRLFPSNILGYANGNSIQVIWACTGIKQAYVFFCIIAFYHGSWKRKLWYIPVGLVIVFLFNILRIIAIALVVNHHPGWFDFVHEHFLKYLFYLVIFGMWVLWEEKLAGEK